VIGPHMVSGRGVDKV